MTGAIVPFKEKIATVRTLFDQLKQQVAMALPRHMSPERMLRIAMTSVQLNPKLLDCTKESLAASLIRASQLGLEPDGISGQAYLVPFKNGRDGTLECQFIPGYRGLIELARRSGQISTIYTHTRREKDTFHYAYGINLDLTHVPYDGEDAGEITHAYAIAKLKDGGVQFEVMSRREIEEVRKRSRAADNGPWVTDWEEMAKKTVLRRLCKYLPCSVELSQAVTLDEKTDAGLLQDLVELDPPAKGKLDRLTEKHKVVCDACGKSDGHVNGCPFGVLEEE